MDNQTTIEALINQIRATEDPPPRYALMRQLAQMGEPAVSYLKKLLYDDEALRFDSALTLAWMGAAGIPTLVEALHSGDNTVTAAVGSVIIETHGADDSFHPVMLEALSHTDPHVRGAGIIWCRAHVLKEAAPMLLNLLRDEDAGVRLMAVEVVGDPFNLTDAVPELIQLLDGPNPEVRLAAVRSLRYVGDERAAPRLIEIYTATDDSWLRTNIIEALSHTKDARAFDFLVSLLKDERTTDFQTIIRSLGWFGNRNVVPHILPFLQREEPLDRLAVVDVLHELADPGTVNVLLTCLTDEYDSVRSRAASTLGRIGDRAVVPDLIPMLGDSNFYMVQATVFALAALGDNRAIKPLRALLNSEDEALCKLADYALDKLGASGKEDT